MTWMPDRVRHDDQKLGVFLDCDTACLGQVRDDRLWRRSNLLLVSGVGFQGLNAFLSIAMRGWYSGRFLSSASSSLSSQSKK
jgi:hypothetical protein